MSKRQKNNNYNNGNIKNNQNDTTNENVNSNINGDAKSNVKGDVKGNFKGNIVIENRGGNNKIFTDDEEKDLYEYISNVFINCNIMFNDEQLRLLSIQKYNMLRKEKDSNHIII